MYEINVDIKERTKNKMRGSKYYIYNNGAHIGGKFIPYSTFFKNAYINADRYVAEVQNRAWSLYNYAKGRNLVNVFVTLTLPTEYHPTRSIFRNGKKIKTVKNKSWIDDEAHNPKNGAKELSKMMRAITNDRAYKSISKDDRVYFRVTEPHKNGPPHLHISFFIPEDSVDSFIAMIKRKFPEPQSKTVTGIHNPVSYLMKYILKTLDDLRGNEDIDNVTDLTIWYVHWGINRFYTSRTLVSLSVYRVLGGRYNMLELTMMERSKEITVWLDPANNKVMEIFENGMLIYNRKPTNVPYESMKVDPKMYLKSMTKKENIYTHPMLYDLDNRTITPAYMGNHALYDYYHGLDVEDESNSLLHYGVVQNEMIHRGLLDDVPIQSLDDFNLDFVDYYDR